MGTVGTHNEPQVAVTDPFNPPADINASTTWAKRLASVRYDIRSVRLGLTGADLWDGLVFVETDTPCVFVRRSGQWRLINVPEFADANTRDTVLTAPFAGDRSRIATDLFDRRYSSSGLWRPYGGALLPIKAASVSANAALGPDGVITFAATTSPVSINGIFSGDFDNYRIIATLDQANPAGGGNVRLRAAGNDDATANYTIDQWIGANSTTLGRSTGTNTTLWNFTAAVGNDYIWEAEIYSPFLATRGTVMLSRTPTFSGPNTGFNQSANKHNVNASYDGISLLNSGTGALSGTIRVYGYVNE